MDLKIKQNKNVDLHKMTEEKFGNLGRGMGLIKLEEKSNMKKKDFHYLYFDNEGIIWKIFNQLKH